jgi:hypothetical protein
MANVAELNAAIAALTTQVASTEGTEASAEALIRGFAEQITAAVTAALTADNNADQASIDAANAAIAEVTARFATSAGKLATAINEVPA